jgi:tetratricopeptide (TPR) repeat protein
MRKIIIALFLVLIFLCSCSNTNKEAVVWFDKANALWDGQKYTNPKKAIEYLSNAIKLQPDYPQAYYNRGNAYYGLGQYQRAIKDYTVAIRLKPNDIDAYYNRGNAFFYLGNNKLGCLDAQKSCALGDCKLLELNKSKGNCR